MTEKGADNLEQTDPNQMPQNEHLIRDYTICCRLMDIKWTFKLKNKYGKELRISGLGENSAVDILKYFSYSFQTFHASCFLWRQFA